MNPAQLLNDAMALHQAGMMDDAENAYRLLLQLQPKHADALALLGTVLSHKNRHDDAIHFIQQALAIDPKAALFHFHLGNAFEKSGKLLQSEMALNRAVNLAPKWGEAFYNLGNVQRRLKKLEDAKKAYMRALQFLPQHTLSHNNLAHTYAEMNDYKNAKQQLEKGLRSAPRDEQLLFSFYDIAMEYYDFPATFDAAQRIARLKLGISDDSSVIDYLESMPRLDTRDDTIRNCLFALGASYFLNMDLREASYILRLLCSHEPDFSDVLNVLGSVALSRNQTEMADAYFAQTFMMNPADISAPWNRSMDLLMMGDLAGGFSRYRWRWAAMEKYKTMRIKADMWDGSDPSGKTIIVQEEQGFGDTLQMLRFIPMLKAKGAHVLAYVRPELYALLQSWDGASQTVSWNAADKTAPAGVDYVCGVMDLPGFLGVGLNTIPAQTPYIPNPRKGLPPFKLESQNLKIGLVWSGNPQHKRNFARSFPFETFEPLFALSGFTFYALQYKPKAEDIALMKKRGVINRADTIHDLADAGATMAELDLLITVDSAPAHLAGALGLPVWTILGADPDWRYLLERTDSPWYPTMRLFRQEQHKDWAGVMLKVKDALVEFQHAKLGHAA